MTLTKKILIGAATLYLIGGLIVSSCLAYAVPATSLAGRAYLTLIWPAMVGHANFHTPQPPIPAWCFDFKN
jgi:low temperature requirement protein LtrA